MNKISNLKIFETTIYDRPMEFKSFFIDYNNEFKTKNYDEKAKEIKRLKKEFLKNRITMCEKYGFDGKQLSHCVRLNEFITRYTIGKETVKDCYISTIPDILINLKKNLNINGTDFMPVELAVKLCEVIDEDTYNIEQEHLGAPINEKNQKYLNDFKYKTIEKYFKKFLKTY